MDISINFKSLVFEFTNVRVRIKILVWKKSIKHIALHCNPQETYTIFLYFITEPLQNTKKKLKTIEIHTLQASISAS